MTAIAAMALVFVSVAALSFTLIQTATSEERQVKRRLKHMSDYVASQVQEAQPLVLPFRERVIRPAGRWFLETVQHAGPSDLRDKMKKRLTTAGHPYELDADKFLAVKLLVTGGVFAAACVVAVLRSTSVPRGLLFAIIAAVAGFFLPDLWLSHTISDRKSHIRRSLPDMLDMLTISVEAGLGFDAALAKLIANSSGPLAEEFAMMLQEVQAGIARRDALRHLAERTDVPELKTFILSIVQAEVFGISINNVLRTQAHEMRKRRRQHAEELAQKAPVKMVFPVVLCILPATMLVIVGPAVISIVRAFGMLLQ